MTNQPEALRLAYLLEMNSIWKYQEKAAAELRRQHDEIEKLRGEVARLTELHTLYQDKTERLKAEHDALVRKMSGYIVDAARYRWLRDFSPMFESVRKTKEDIDEKIDFARNGR